MTLSRDDTKSIVSLNRLEAFTDGVIAIIITLLVFDIKVPNVALSSNVDFLKELKLLLPNILAYILSFIVLLAWWLSHHELFKRLKFVDNRLIVINGLFLLFICLIPFPTSVLGNHYSLPYATVLYGIVSLLCAISFFCLRLYMFKNPVLMRDGDKVDNVELIRSSAGIPLYAFGIALANYNIVAGIGIYLLVPFLYLKKLTTKD